MLGSVIDAEAHLAGLIKQYPLGRIGQSKDISDAVMWLCSDSTSFITGVSLSIEGGKIS